MPTLKAGQTIGGYEIVAFHGNGGMGEIFRARQVSIGREVALKVLNPELARKDPSFAKKFVDEARAAGRLNHPNIIAVHDVGRVKNGEEYLYYFSMEFVEGDNLRQTLQAHGTLDLELIGLVMTGMSEALVYAEQMGMVHRDIKPENIMVTPDRRIKLADFGLALSVDAADDNERDDNGRVKVMGTPRYMSPEQARGKSVDARSDQYSLGASLFHFLTGSPPYRRDKARDLMKAHVFEPTPDPNELVKVSPAWRAVCMKLMAKKADDRYHSAEEMREAVMHAINGQSFRGHRIARRTGNHQAVSEKRSSVPMVLVVIVVVAAGAIGAFMMMPKGGNPNPSLPVSSSSSGTSSGDSSSGEAASEDAKVERARSILAGLPNDSQQRLAAIATALGNPYFSPGSQGRLMLEQARAETQLVIQNQQKSVRQGILNKLATIVKVAEAGNIRQARADLSGISDDDKRLAGAAFAQSEAQIRRAAQGQRDSFLQQINTAADQASIDRIIASAEEKNLYLPQVKSLREAGTRRLTTLQREAQVSQAKLSEADAKRFQNLCEDLRSYLAQAQAAPRTGFDAPRIGAFRAAAWRERDRFNTSQYKEIVKELVAVAERSSAMDEALNEWLKVNKPSIRLQVGSNTRRALIIEKVGTHFNIEIVGSAAAIKKPLNDESIPVLDFLSKAANKAGFRDGLHQTAWLWMWQMPQTEKALEPLSTHRQTAAMKRVQPKMVVMHKVQPNNDEQPVVAAQTDGSTIDFTDGDAAHAQLFTGKGLSVSNKGLRWLCAETIAYAGLVESDLPTMKLASGLSLPCTITINYEIEAGSLILIGIARNNKFARLAINTSDGRIGGIVTVGKENVGSVPVPRKHPNAVGPQQMKISVSEKGAVRYALNGADFTDDGQVLTHQTAANGDAEFIIQALQQKGRKSSITITSMSIEAE